MPVRAVAEGTVRPVGPLIWPELAALGVDAVVTARSGGVSSGPYASMNLGLHVGDDAAAVVENRRRAAALVGARLEDCVYCTQAHGRAVQRIGSADRGRGTVDAATAVADVDALVVGDPGVVAVVLMADCVPVLLVDPVARLLAVVHAGWRGTVADVVGATVDELRLAGADVGRIRAWIGPAVDPGRYQVGDDVRDAADERFGADTPAVVVPDGTGRWRFDLWTANELLLRRAGVAGGNVSRVAALPTGTTGGDRFFSDRDERPCGRFGLLARLRP